MKTSRRASRVDRLAKRLSVRFRGKFAAIDPDTGRYFVGKDHLEVLLRARAEMPQTIFELKRLGSPFAFSVKLTLL